MEYFFGIELSGIFNEQSRNVFFCIRRKQPADVGKRTIEKDVMDDIEFVFFRVQTGSVIGPKKMMKRRWNLHRRESIP